MTTISTNSCFPLTLGDVAVGSQGQPAVKAELHLRPRRSLGRHRR